MDDDNSLDSLREKCKFMKEGGHLIKIHQRFCRTDDVEGLRKIIRDDQRISFIEVIPRNPSLLNFNGCDEYFYTTNDVDFNQVAREQILKI